MEKNKDKKSTKGEEAPENASFSFRWEYTGKKPNKLKSKLLKKFGIDIQYEANGKATASKENGKND